jgi:signal transduction histidine kinase
LSTLSSRFVLALLALALAVAAGGVAFTLVTAREYWLEVDQRLNRQLAGDLLREVRPEGGEGLPGTDELYDVFHAMMVVNPRIEIYLLDREGEILAFSAPPERVVRERVDLAPVRRFLAGGTPGDAPIVGDDPRDAAGQKTFSVAAIGDPSGEPEGYLYVVLAGEEMESVASSVQGGYALRLAGWLALASVLAALVAALLLWRVLTRRLRRLDAKIHRFEERYEELGHADGATLEPAAIEDRDEMDRLEAAFDRMAGRISAQIDALERSDRLRRELVANVSHDLRTPLAALQGSLETLMLPELDLGAEERQEVLEIARSHSERLGRLVGELFELARLDAGETRPELEEVALAELVQDVAQRLRLLAQARSVTLATDLPPDLPFVSADVGLIERVLVNLVENAITHTPEGGTVTLALERGGKDREDGGGQGVVVRVEDTGSGIAPEDLPRIFDRFYQGGGRSRAGAGLGLAIAQRILALHGSAIRVESAPERGAAFSFALEAA